MVVLTRLSRGNQLNEDRKLLVRRAGSAWAEPESSAYENEAHLQEILAADPSQIPGVDAAPLTAIELPTAGGFVDVCVVGRNGSITVVECKLASNSERRRMVIGQVIDYAAAIWLDGADAFLASWERCAGKDLAVELDAEALEALRASITEGRIDLCLAVDKIDSDLRRLVEYLNQVTAPEVRVTSLQLSYAKHGDVEILIPSTFGGEIAEAKARKSDRVVRWTVETFLAALASDDDRARATELFKRVEDLEQLGEKEPFYCGEFPGGGIYISPHGLSYAPIWLSINTQQKLMVTASWNWFADVRHHEGFGPLAQLMGLDHTGSAQGRQLAENAAWERERRVSDQTKQPKSRRTFSWSAVPVDLKRALLADRDDEHRQVDAADDETLAGWLTERYGARPHVEVFVRSGMGPALLESWLSTLSKDDLLALHTKTAHQLKTEAPSHRRADLLEFLGSRNLALGSSSLSFGVRCSPSLSKRDRTFCRFGLGHLVLCGGGQGPMPLVGQCRSELGLGQTEVFCDDVDLFASVDQFSEILGANAGHMRSTECHVRLDRNR